MKQNKRILLTQILGDNSVRLCLVNTKKISLVIDLGSHRMICVKKRVIEVSNTIAEIMELWE